MADAPDPFLAAATETDDPFLRAATASAGPRPIPKPTASLARLLFSASGAGPGQAPLGSIPSSELPEQYRAGLSGYQPMGYPTVGVPLLDAEHNALQIAAQQPLQAVGNAETLLERGVRAIPGSVVRLADRLTGHPLPAPASPVQPQIGAPGTTAPMVAPTPSTYGERANSIAARLIGGNPNTPSGQVGAFGGQLAPFLFGEQALGAPFVNAVAPEALPYVQSLGRMTVAGAATGALQNPDAPLQGALQGAKYAGGGLIPLEAAGGALGAVGRGAGALLDRAPAAIQSGVDALGRLVPASVANEQGALFGATTPGRLLMGGAGGTAIGAGIGALTGPAGEKQRAILNDAALGGLTGVTGVALAELADRRGDLFRDPLTGAGNAHAYAEALPRTEANPNTAIVSGDLINLKPRNDLPANPGATASHAVGDAYIVHNVTAARQAVQDVLGVNAAEAQRMVFRPHAKGDELSILDVPKDQAPAVAARWKELAGTPEHAGWPGGVTVGVGGTAAEAETSLAQARAQETVARYRPQAPLPPPPQAPPPDVPPARGPNLNNESGALGTRGKGSLQAQADAAGIQVRATGLNEPPRPLPSDPRINLRLATDQDLAAMQAKLDGALNDPTARQQIQAIPGYEGRLLADQQALVAERRARLNAVASKGSILGDESGRIGLFHGSPHKFPPVRMIEDAEGNRLVQGMDEPVPTGAKVVAEYPQGRFDASKIGTGEGAQSYGHGLYLAGDKSVGKYYRDTLAPRPEIQEVKLGNRRVGQQNNFDYNPRSNDSVENVRSSLFEDLLLDENGITGAQSQGQFQQHVLKALDERIAGYRQEWPEGVAAAKQLRQELSRPGAVSLKVKGGGGALYTVEHSGEPDHFLDWDKPLSQQSAYVQEALHDAADKGERTGDDVVAELLNDATDKSHPNYGDASTGRHIYEILSDKLGGSDKASEYLRQRGIAGNKYLDAGSRGKGTGSHNYVVFDDNALDITGREGQGALPILGGLAGTGLGAAAGYTQGATPEERVRNAILGGAAGLALGAGGGAVAENGARDVATEATPTEAASGFAKVADDFRRTFAPASRTPEARFTGDVLRARGAEFAQKNAQLSTQLHGLARSFDAAPEADRLAFIDRMERGQAQPTLPLTQAASALRGALDEARTAITNQTGKLDHFIENYFPHIWANPDQAQSVVGKMLGKRPLEGTKGFLKARTIPTTAEGIEAGLTPVTTNPVDLTLLKLREMHKYLMGQQVLGDLHQEGLLKFVPASARAPEGYVALNPKVATVTERGKITGQQYAPAPVAQVVNNYLSPGLGGNAVYDAYRSLGNTLNQAQLGLSAFHLGFTSLDAAVSKAALAVEQLSQGQPLRALGSAARVPIAPLENLVRGDQVLKEYLTPGSAPAMADIVHGLVQGGGRAVLDDFYKTGAVDRFLKAWREGNVGTAVRTGIPAAIEASSKPILEYLVPRQKLGVFADLWKQEMERLGPGATDAEVRRAAAKAWDSVDNRMGQMVYDNLFWNRAVKDLGMASVRSVGWNLGTIRELGGGASDLLGAGKNLLTGQRPQLSHRAAYLAALPVTVGLVGGMMHYLATGQAPQELRDYFFPKTGRTNPDGTDERVQLPSYLKDVYNYTQSPWQTLKHKVNPALATVTEMLDNRDFYGNMIRNPDDPFVQQVGQEVAHAAQQFVPFGIRYAQDAERRGQSRTTTGLNFVGVTPAPRSVVRSDAQNRMAELLARRGKMTLTPEQASAQETRYDLERQLAQDRPAGQRAVQTAIAAGTLSRAQGQAMQRRSFKDPDALRFQQLTLPEALDVYQRGKPEERAVWWTALQRKEQNAARGGDLAGVRAFRESKVSTLPRTAGATGAISQSTASPAAPDPFLEAAQAAGGPR